MSHLQNTLLYLILILSLTFVNCGVIIVSNVKSSGATSLDARAQHLSKKSWTTKENGLRPRSPMERGEGSGGGSGGGSGDDWRSTPFSTNNLSPLDYDYRLYPIQVPAGSIQPLFPGIQDQVLGALSVFDDQRRHPWHFSWGVSYSRARGRTHEWDLDGVRHNLGLRMLGQEHPVHRMYNAIEVHLAQIGLIGEFELTYELDNRRARIRFVPHVGSLEFAWPRERSAYLVSFILIFGVVRMDTGQVIPPDSTSYRIRHGSAQWTHYNDEFMRTRNRYGRWGGYGYQLQIYGHNVETNEGREILPIAVPVSASYRLGPETSMPFLPRYRIYWEVLAVEIPNPPAMGQLPGLLQPRPQLQPQPQPQPGPRRGSGSRRRGRGRGG